MCFGQQGACFACKQTVDGSTDKVQKGRRGTFQWNLSVEPLLTNSSSHCLVPSVLSFPLLRSLCSDQLIPFPLSQNASAGVSRMLLGNKCDIEGKRKVSKETGEKVRCNPPLVVSIWVMVVKAHPGNSIHR